MVLGVHQHHSELVLLRLRFVVGRERHDDHEVTDNGQRCSGDGGTMDLGFEQVPTRQPMPSPRMMLSMSRVRPTRAAIATTVLPST